MKSLSIKEKREVMNKKGIEWITFFSLLLAVAIAIIVIVGIYMVLSGKGLNAIEMIKNFLNFGG